MSAPGRPQVLYLAAVDRLTGPPSPLRELAAANNNVYLHSGGRHQLRELGCRAVIEPLMFEQHVVTKLVNAMSQGPPVITTQEGMRRAHA